MRRDKEIYKLSHFLSISSNMNVIEPLQDILGPAITYVAVIIKCLIVEYTEFNLCQKY